MRPPPLVLIALAFSAGIGACAGVLGFDNLTLGTDGGASQDGGGSGSGNGGGSSSGSSDGGGSGGSSSASSSSSGSSGSGSGGGSGSSSGSSGGSSSGSGSGGSSSGSSSGATDDDGGPYGTLGSQCQTIWQAYCAEFTASGGVGTPAECVNPSAPIDGNPCCMPSASSAAIVSCAGSATPLCAAPAKNPPSYVASCVNEINANGSFILQESAQSYFENLGGCECIANAAQ